MKIYNTTIAFATANLFPDPENYALLQWCHSNSITNKILHYLLLLNIEMLNNATAPAPAAKNATPEADENVAAAS